MAQYIEGDDRNQSMLLPAAIDDYVSPASPVRAIDAFVDQLDLAPAASRSAPIPPKAAVDAKHHLIATVEVTQGGNDQHSLDPVAQQAKQDLELAADAPLTATSRQRLWQRSPARRLQGMSGTCAMY